MDEVSSSDGVAVIAIRSPLLATMAIDAMVEDTIHRPLLDMMSLLDAAMPVISAEDNAMSQRYVRQASPRFTRHHSCASAPVRLRPTKLSQPLLRIQRQRNAHRHGRNRRVGIHHGPPRQPTPLSVSHQPSANRFALLYLHLTRTQGTH
jgi:hypothetical protein